MVGGGDGGGKPTHIMIARIEVTVKVVSLILQGGTEISAILLTVV